MQEVTGSSPVPSTKTKPEVTGPGFLFCTGIAEAAPVRVLYCCAAEPRPADETGEAQRKRGASSGRNSRAGVGAAVQIYEPATAGDGNLANSNQRGRGLNVQAHCMRAGNSGHRNPTHHTVRIRTQSCIRTGSDTFFLYQKFFAAGRIEETEGSLPPEPANPRPGEWMRHSSERGFFAWISIRDERAFLSRATGSQRAPAGRFRHRQLHR